MSTARHPSATGGCGDLGLTCAIHFLTDALHGILAGFLQPFRDAQSCFNGSLTGCANTTMFLLDSPLYALKNTITGTVNGTRGRVDIEVLIRNNEIWTGYPLNLPRNP